MALRNSSADSGKKGEAVTPNTKGGPGTYLYTPPSCKGAWLPAYSGGMGRTAEAVDSDFGTAENEVGNDYDNDYDNPSY